MDNACEIVDKYNVRIVTIDNLEQAKYEINLIGSDIEGVNWMAPKGVFRAIKLENVPLKVANILKQEMLSKGGEAALAREVLTNSVETTDILLMGTNKQYRKVVQKLNLQPFGLPKLGLQILSTLKDYEPRKPYILNCRGKELPLGERTLIMGILNVTPDSFSDGGKFFGFENAIQQAKRMVEEGADIIDVGGESTRPNHEPVSSEEEIARIVPVIKRLVSEVGVPISVDTYKADVARAALENGAHIINDIWGLTADPEMAGVAAEYDAPVIIMHNQDGTEYDDLMGDMIKFFKRTINIALQAGVKRENIIIDPGIGFGKTTEQNIEVMSRLKELNSLGQPILLATSRKSMIGNTLNLPVTERLEGTAATVTLGITYGSDIVRIHDVKEMVRVVKMTDAMVRRKNNG